MKLEKIHLGGFKSFADPTSIDLTEQMTGIVGPNGCGKSNIVDAIRWVMGETPRHIRASSFDEVIFNGATGRKPMGKAFVELVFNNADGSLKGEYAQYNELSLRRVVSRDQETKYYLNNKRCRRKDIADIFLGTGLGSNNYAIIEQGMIAKLIEAKPQEMWRHIEEAAGISRYKQRRSETETRIKHTRDNLERVMDLRDEIDRQLRRLKKQGTQANRYKQLCIERDALEGDLKWLRMRDYQRACAEAEKELTEKKTQLQDKQKSLRKVESDLEVQRKSSSEMTGAGLAAKEKLHRLEVQMNALNSEIQQHETSVVSAEAEQQTCATQKKDIGIELEAEQQKLGALEMHTTELLGKHEQLVLRINDLRTRMPMLEQELESLRKLRDKHQSESQESSETAKVEKTRSEFFHQALGEIDKTFSDLKVQRDTIDLSALMAERDDKQNQLSECQVHAAAVTQSIEHNTRQIQELREKLHQFGDELNSKQEQVQSIQGQITSLEVLMEAKLGHDKASFHAWLDSAGLSTQNLVSEKIDVASGWENAVETVLGVFLEGVRVEALSEQKDFVPKFSKGTLVMVEGSALPATAGTLGEKVSASSGLQQMLSQVQLVDNIEVALQKRGQLSTGESLITKDGIWMGKNWLQVRRFEEEHEGVLMQKHRIETLQQQYQKLLRHVAELKQEMETMNNTLAQQEMQRDEAQAEQNKSLSKIATLTADVSRCEEKIKHQELQLVKLGEMEAMAKTRRQALVAEHEQSLEEYGKAEAQIQEVTTQFGNVETAIVEKEKNLTLEKSSLEMAQTELHQVELDQESTRGAQGISTKNRDQLKMREEALQLQIVKLEQHAKDRVQPIEEKKIQLSVLNKEHEQVQTKQTSAEEKQQVEKSKLDELFEQRQVLAGVIDKLRLVHDEMNAKVQVNQARYEDACTAFEELALDGNEIAERLAKDLGAQAVEASLQESVVKIEKLGPINLVALEEFQECEGRKQTIDEQHQDLTTALETLETAIKKIDQETSMRFKTTFERINENLKEIFPMLFEGGEAYLRMIETEGIEGITVMVRPPGKRLSSIQLMSGGEKALAAAAVIFSIFKLNPAPFCVLDEVDAPLDEHNVKVFCDMLRRMHEQLQIIMITHNKISMEYVDTLIGVTMYESGVSRLVSVDIDQALEMKSA